MGIGYRTAVFLSSCRKGVASKEAVDYSNVLTLGRQYFQVADSDYERLLKYILGDSYTKERNSDFVAELKRTASQLCPNTVYSEPFFKLLSVDIPREQGKHEDRHQHHCNTTCVDSGGIDSLDYSDFEGATIIHDMNMPVPGELKNKYTCVIDGGMLEHIYEYTTGLRNAMDMVAIGGHLIVITQANNYFGHGFYQFSPELFYSVLREENGFTDTRIYSQLKSKGRKWYLITNPRKMNARNMAYKGDIMMYIVSKKINAIPDHVTAFQSDYEIMWDNMRTSENGTIAKEQSAANELKDLTLRKRIYRLLPPPIKLLVDITHGYRKCIKENFKPVRLR